MAAHRKYDWEELFKQEQSLLERGEDYHCSQSNIIQQIRNEASKRRLRVKIVDMDNKVVIRVLRSKDEVHSTNTTAVVG